MSKLYQPTVEDGSSWTRHTRFRAPQPALFDKSTLSSLNPTPTVGFQKVSATASPAFSTPTRGPRRLSGGSNTMNWPPKNLNPLPTQKPGPQAQIPWPVNTVRNGRLDLQPSVTLSDVLPNLTELVSGTYDNGTPVLPSHQKTRASRFVAASNSHANVAKAATRQNVDEVRPPLDEKKLLASIGFLETKVAQLEKNRIESEQTIQNLQKMVEERQEKSRSRRSDSAIGSADGVSNPSNELPPMENKLQSKIDLLNKVAFPHDSTMHKIAGDRDAAVSQLATAYFTNDKLAHEIELLKNENDQLKDEHCRANEHIAALNDRVSALDDYMAVLKEENKYLKQHAAPRAPKEGTSQQSVPSAQAKRLTIDDVSLDLTYFSYQDKTEKTGEVQSTTPLGTPVQGSVRADTSISWSTPDTHSRSPTFRIVSNSQTSDSNIVPDATGFGTASDPSEPFNYIEGFTGFTGPSNQGDSQLMADYPSDPPSPGLATVLQQLNDDLRASKQKLAKYQGLYDSHDPALSSRSRQSVAKKLQAMGEEIDAKADRIASLYGVLESQRQQNQQMRADRNLTI